MDNTFIIVSAIIISLCSGSSDNIPVIHIDKLHGNDGNITWNDAILMILTFVMVMFIVVTIINCVNCCDDWYNKYSIKNIELQDFDETEPDSEEVQFLP